MLAVNALMKKRVLIMSAGAGTGHIRAAEALELSFAADGRVAEVVNNDALQYTNKLFRDFYSSFYLAGAICAEFPRLVV